MLEFLQIINEWFFSVGLALAVKKSLIFNHHKVNIKNYNGWVLQLNYYALKMLSTNAYLPNKLNLLIFILIHMS